MILKKTITHTAVRSTFVAMGIALVATVATAADPVARTQP